MSSLALFMPNPPPTPFGFLLDHMWELTCQTWETSYANLFWTSAASDCWALEHFHRVTTVSLTQLEHLGWHFKYFLFTTPLERDLAISKQCVCIYPWTSSPTFRTLLWGSSSVGGRIMAPQRRPCPHPHKLWLCSPMWQKGLHRCD